MKPKNLKEAAQVAHGSSKEPTWTDDTMTIPQALTWYNYFSDLKDAKKYTINYLTAKKYDKEKIKLVQNLADWHFITIGYVCRIAERGAPLLPINYTWIENKIAELFAATETVEEETVVGSLIIPTISIQQRVEQVSQEFIEELELTIDNSINSKDFSFNAYDWMTKTLIKPMHAKSISKYYQTRLAEIAEALNGQDEQLVEAYKFLTTSQLTKYHALIKRIVDDADRIVHNGKSQKVPKKRKTPTAEKLISKLIYKREDVDYKIKSVNPIDILGAKQVWVFNTKTRKLGVYVSYVGMSIKGTTLTDFNESNSIQKTLRAPLNVLPMVISGTKSTLNPLLENINSMPVKMTGRINADVIILRTIK